MSKHLAEIAVVVSLLAIAGVGCRSQSLNFSPPLPLDTISQPLNSPRADSHSSLSVLEQEIYKKVNEYRRSRHLPPLKLNARISQEARIHSEQMAAKTAPFSHQGFEGRVKNLAAVLPLQAAAENLAVNQGFGDPAATAVQGWIESPGHRQAMEGDFNLTGIGGARSEAGEYYFTQIFLRQPPANAAFSAYENAPVADAAFLTILEGEIHNRVNQYRLSRNLPLLRLDARISYEARLHSQAMAKGSVPFSHDGFASRVRTIGKTIPYRKAGENLAVLKGYPDLVETAVQGWIDSSGHRQAMEGDFNLSGVGIAKNTKEEYYFTQIFLKEP